MRSDAWTREQLLEAIKLYCVTPFGRLHNRNPEIVALAARLGRTASALALKLVNFAALDTTIARSGMGNYSKRDAEIWSEFFNDMDRFLEHTMPSGMAEEAREFERRPDGRDIPIQTTARSGQSFFRSMILASYDGKCALTDIDAPDLLVASHIQPWAGDAAQRTNPCNGLLLNRLHDRAFDAGLMVLDNDLTVHFSPKLSPVTREKLERSARPQLRVPSRFLPDLGLLKRHREEAMRQW